MTDLPASYLHSVNEGRLGKSLAQVAKQIVDQLSSHFAESRPCIATVPLKNNYNYTSHCMLEVSHINKLEENIT